MPINPSTGAFQRIWKFVDRFAQGDDITREDLDLALDDFVPALNEAILVLTAAQVAAAQAQAFALQASTNGETAGAAAGAAAAESAAALQTAAALAHAQEAELAKLAAQGFAASINPLNLMGLATETAFAGNLDTVEPSAQRVAVYRLNTGVTGGPAGAGVNDFVLHMRWDASNATQICFNSGDVSLLSHRSKIGGVWGTWSAVMTTNGDHLVTGGRTFATVDDGTRSSGTYTPSPIGGNARRIVNGGAFTLAAPVAAGDYEMRIQITNNASAGVITLTGFSRVTGDALTTTNGDDFLLVITKINGFILCERKALQ